MRSVGVDALAVEELTGTVVRIDKDAVNSHNKDGVVKFVEHPVTRDGLELEKSWP